VSSKFEEPVGRDSVEDETAVRPGGDTAAGLQRYVSNFMGSRVFEGEDVYIGIQVCAYSASTAGIAAASDSESGING